MLILNLPSRINDDRFILTPSHKTLNLYVPPHSCLSLLQLYRQGAPLHTRPCSSLPRLSCPQRRHPTFRTPPSATHPTSTLLIPSRATCRHMTRPAHRAARSVFFTSFLLRFFFPLTLKDPVCRPEVGGWFGKTSMASSSSLLSCSALLPSDLKRLKIR